MFTQCIWDSKAFELESDQTETQNAKNLTMFKLKAKVLELVEFVTGKLLSLDTCFLWS